MVGWFMIGVILLMLMLSQETLSDTTLESIIKYYRMTLEHTHADVFNESKETSLEVFEDSMDLKWCL